LRSSGLFHECQQVCATKSSLAAQADAKAMQHAGIRPPAERCLAHVQKLGGFADIK
jgi:hypothetical protein